jgi:hypothetical protein
MKSVIVKGRKWTREELTALVESNDTALNRFIIRIYNQQEADEQRVEQTRKVNGCGFNSSDAPFMSSLAKQILSGLMLSARQKIKARKAMKKYVGQLMVLMREEEKRKEKSANV